MTSNFRRRLLRTCLATCALMVAFGATAQTFPTKQVRIISPFPVGGGPDGVARLVADKLSRRWGTGVIVENRPGGNGFIAIDAWKRGARDGHDLLILDNVHLAAYPALFKKLPYDAEKDFDTLLPLFKTHFFFTVGNHSKYKTVADIVADAKAHPGKLNYGSWSIGNPVHLGLELFESMTGTQMEHVIFKETTQLYTSVSTGEIDFALGSAATVGPLHRGGKLRLLAVTGAQRLAEFPDVPTVAESGGPKDFTVTGWNAIAAPPGLPPSVAEKIRNDIAAALTGTDVVEKFKSFGYEPFPVTRAQFSQFTQEESRRFGDVIRKAHIALD